MPFQDTPNKLTLRQSWDLPILNRWHAGLSRPLSYFGLPGPEIKDLIDWQHLLGSRTGVEVSGRTKKQRLEADETSGRLNFNIMAYGLGSGFELLRGDIEDVIINGTDDTGKVPQMNDGLAAHLMHFNYDLVNLDFNSGLGYRRESQRGDAKRVRAIKELFRRQQGQSFVFLLTVSVRHTLGEEISEYINGLRGLYNDSGWHNTIDWYLGLGEREFEYALKALVPPFIRAAAAPYMFRTTCHPPISYIGHERARMVHFAFELEAQSGNLQAFSRQNDRDLIELPLLRCDNGQITTPSKQHPNFDFGRCENFLQFLPNETKASILATIIGS